MGLAHPIYSLLDRIRLLCPFLHGFHRHSVPVDLGFVCHLCVYAILGIEKGYVVHCWSYMARYYSDESALRRIGVQAHLIAEPKPCGVPCQGFSPLNSANKCSFERFGGNFRVLSRCAIGSSTNVITRYTP